MAERKVSKTIRDDNSGVDFEFYNGDILNTMLLDIPDETKLQLMLHGLSAKVGDSYAGEDADKCYSIAQSVYTSLTEGKWSARSGSGGGPRISQLADAMARETGKSIEDCVSFLAEADDDTKKAIRAHSGIKRQLAAIKLEKAQAELEKSQGEGGTEDEFDLSQVA